jgi:uncharacterized protein YoxC
MRRLDIDDLAQKVADMGLSVRQLEEGERALATRFPLSRL